MSDDIVSESVEYSPKSEFSKPTLVQQSVEKCLILRSVEMRGGYYNYQMNGSDIANKIWIADSRKSFCASVEALRILLTPEISRDDAYKIAISKILENKKKLFDKYSIEDNGEKYIPFSGETKVKQRRVLSGRTSFRTEEYKVLDFYDKQISLYWNNRLELADDLFELLNSLVDSLNYFKSGARF